MQSCIEAFNSLRNRHHPDPATLRRGDRGGSAARSRSCPAGRGPPGGARHGYLVAVTMAAKVAVLLCSRSHSDRRRRRPRRPTTAGELIVVLDGAEPTDGTSGGYSGGADNKDSADLFRHT